MVDNNLSRDVFKLSLEKASPISVLQTVGNCSTWRKSPSSVESLANFRTFGVRLASLIGGRHITASKVRYDKDLNATRYSESE